MRILKSYLGSACLVSYDDKPKLEFGLIVDINHASACKVFFPYRKKPEYASELIESSRIKAIGPKPNFDTLLKKMIKPAFTTEVEII